MTETIPMAPPPRADLHEPARVLFDLGQLYATRGLIAHLEANPDTTVQALVHRHVSGDYGELSSRDRRANVDAIAIGARILSAYIVAGEKVYLITEGTAGEGPGRIATALEAVEYGRCRPAGTLRHSSRPGPVSSTPTLQRQSISCPNSIVSSSKSAPASWNSIRGCPGAEAEREALTQAREYYGLSS
jgi:hypothetical protein